MIQAIQVASKYAIQFDVAPRNHRLRLRTPKYVQVQYAYSSWLFTAVPADFECVSFLYRNANYE